MYPTRQIMTGQRQPLLELLEFCVQHQLHRAAATVSPPLSSTDSLANGSDGSSTDIDINALIVANMTAASADLKAAQAADRASEATAARIRALIKTHAPSLFGAVLLDLFRHVQVAPLPPSPASSPQSPSTSQSASPPLTQATGGKQARPAVKSL